MKKAMKLMGIAASLSAILFALPVEAASTGFVITSNSSYGDKSSANTKLDYNTTAYINWQSSSQSSHNEWFQIVNSNNEARSDEYLFPYLTANTMPEYSSMKYGYYYYLRARREHIINPQTTVRGTWES